jgi:hypothetical protein
MAIGITFIGAAALAVAAAHIGLLGAAHAQSGQIDPSYTPGVEALTMTPATIMTSMH